MLILGAAVLVSAGVGFAVRSLVGPRHVEPQREAPAIGLGPLGRPVLAAARPIARGHIIEASDLRWQAWPEKPGPAFIRDRLELRDRRRLTTEKPSLQTPHPVTGRIAGKRLKSD